MGKRKKREKKQKTGHETQRDVEVVRCHSACVSSRKQARLRWHLHIHAPVVLVVLLFARGGHNSRVRDPGGVHAWRAQHEGVGEPGRGGRQTEWVHRRRFQGPRGAARAVAGKHWAAAEPTVSIIIWPYKSLPPETDFTRRAQNPACGGCFSHKTPLEGDRGSVKQQLSGCEGTTSSLRGTTV